MIRNWKRMLLLLLVPALLRCKGGKVVDETQPPVPVKTVIAAVDDHGALVSYSGLVKPAPDRHALLQTPGNLVVEAVLVKPGDRVRTGQLLVSLRPDQPAAEDRRKAELGLARATQDRKRIAALVAAGAAPQSQLDEARNLEAQASAEAAGKRQLAGYAVRSSQITAPFAGTVLRVDAVAGQLAQPSQALVELADLSALRIEILVPQTMTASLHAGLEVGIRCPGCPEGSKGLISRIFPAPDGASLQVPVWITPAAVSLASGASASVDIILPGSGGGLWLPDDAVLMEGGEHRIFAVVNDKAEARTVTVGLRNAGRTQLLSGLKPGDRVVVEGGWQLLDGTLVSEAKADAKPEAKAGKPPGNQ